MIKQMVKQTVKRMIERLQEIKLLWQNLLLKQMFKTNGQVAIHARELRNGQTNGRTKG
jgi:hypothetical protein